MLISCPYRTPHLIRFKLTEEDKIFSHCTKAGTAADGNTLHEMSLHEYMILNYKIITEKGSEISNQ